MELLPLPLPASELPETIRRFGDPAAPTPARSMAARGLVPVRGGDLVTLLVQLGADADTTVGDAAKKTLASVPDAVLTTAAEAAIHPSILDALADHFRSRDDLLERLVLNRALHDSTIVRIGRSCSESIAEAIAVNEQRLLRTPRIVEVLYMNPATRMSTADRMVELCARNGVNLDGIPAFKDHVEAIAGQLIPEPSPEPLPDDVSFVETLAVDGDEDAIEHDPVEDKEKVKKKHLPLRTQIEKMKKQEKIRLAQMGSGAARSILVRDPVKAVARAAISSPKMTVAEAAGIATSREVSADVLTYIGHKKKWLGSAEVKRALVFNPKTPQTIALSFLGHLPDHDLKALGKSRNVPAAIKNAASQRIEQKTKGRGKK